MSREQMVEKAARVLCKSQNPGVERAWLAYRDEWLKDAAAVLDAILPQVTTVAELEALPNGSVILDNDWGAAYELTAGGWISAGDLEVDRLEADDLPMTVVWTPEPEAGDRS